MYITLTLYNKLPVMVNINNISYYQISPHNDEYSHIKLVGDETHLVVEQSIEEISRRIGALK